MLIFGKWKPFTVFLCSFILNPIFEGHLVVGKWEQITTYSLTAHPVNIYCVFDYIDMDCVSSAQRNFTKDNGALD